MPSFDIVCEINIQELKNSINQSRKEINNRYDFKGINCSIDLNDKEYLIILIANDEFKMQILNDILLTKLIKRSIPVKALVYGKTEKSGKLLRKEIQIQKGLSKDNCKEINLILKKSKFKVQCQTQNDYVRVSSKKKDELQFVINYLKEINISFDIQFTNYR